MTIVFQGCDQDEDSFTVSSLQLEKGEREKIKGCQSLLQASYWYHQ